MNPILAELLHGAGLSDIVSEPLQGGKVRTTKASGFIRRLMYENSLKHDGQYKYPVWKLHKDSEMDEPQKFVYKELANKQQDGDKDTAYGASPFIQKHFGTNRAVEFVRGRKHKKGDPKQESEAQREKRKDYPYRKKRKASKQQPQQSVEQQEERPAVVEEEDQPEVAEERPQDVAEDDKKYAEEHSAERTQSEYDRMFPKKSASKEKESLRKKEAYQRGKEEAKNRQYDYDLPEIPDELKPYIKEEDLEAILPGLVKRAKMGLLYKKAREVLPKGGWKITPPIIKMLDKMNSKLIEEMMKRKNTEENQTFERIRARQDEFEKELQSRPEIKRLAGTPQWRQAWSSQVGDLNRAKNHYLNEVVDEMIQSQLPDPGITKENVATYKIPKNYF